MTKIAPNRATAPVYLDPDWDETVELAQSMRRGESLRFCIERKSGHFAVANGYGNTHYSILRAVESYWYGKLSRSDRLPNMDLADLTAILLGPDATGTYTWIGYQTGENGEDVLNVLAKLPEPVALFIMDYMKLRRESRVNPKAVPEFIQPESKNADQQVKKVYRFLSLVFHPDSAITGRAERGLSPLNEGLFDHVDMFTRATEAYELAQQAKAEGYRRLNLMLVPWRRSPPHMTMGDVGVTLVRGVKKPLELPPDYVKHKVAEKAARRGELIEGMAGQQTQRPAVLKEAALYWLKKGYGPLWSSLDKGLREARTIEAIGHWTITHGTPQGFVATLAGRKGAHYTNRFDELGLTEAAVKARAISWSSSVQQFMETMKEAAQTTIRENITADRAAVGKEAAGQQVHAEDVWTRPPETPEEELSSRRARERAEDRLSALEDALAALAASGPAGKIKVIIIQLHLGEEVLPKQPPRLLGRLRSSGQRAGQTSQAYRDLSGEIWGVHSKGELVQKGQASRYHGPLSPGRAVLVDGNPGVITTTPKGQSVPSGHHAVLHETKEGVRLRVLPSSLLQPAICPTCVTISRFVRVREVGPEEIAGIISDFSSRLL